MTDSSTSVDSRSRSRSVDSDEDNSAFHLIEKSLGRGYKQATPSMTTSADWGPCEGYASELNLPPSGDLRDLERTRNLNLPPHYQRLAETYNQHSGGRSSFSHQQLQQPAGHFDAVNQLWTRAALSVQDLMNPSGMPSEHGAFRETALNKLLKAATTMQIPSTSDAVECGHFTAFRALAELLAAVQSMVINSKCLHNVIHGSDPELWCKVSPMVRNWTYSTVLAREAFDLAAQADALLKNKIGPGEKFAEFHQARRERLRLHKTANDFNAAYGSAGTYVSIPRKANRGRGRNNNRGRGAHGGRGKKRKRGARKPNPAKRPDSKPSTAQE